MKRYLLAVFVIVFTTTFSLQSQNLVHLNIHHKLGAEDFSMTTTTVNNLNQEFNFTRLTYYIAEISLLHDGGQETAISDMYLLVKANNETSVDLGSYDVNNIEAIRFHIGVDEAVNHLDPAAQANGSALAPQNPSMHWGWNAGYRFIALEGQTGTNMNQFWELHGLEDENYFQTEVALNHTAVDGVVTIDLNADYSRALEGINMNSVPVVHGGFGDAKLALENFRDYVYSPAMLVNTRPDISELNYFKVYPNPATSQDAQFKIEATTTEVYSVAITDLSGRRVKYFPSVAGNTIVDLELQAPGMYLVQLYKAGQQVLIEKLLIQK